MNVIRSILLSLLLALPGATARAASVQWSGQGDGFSWNDAANWTPVGIPGTSDDVSISSSVTVIANSASGVALKSLTVGNGVSSTTLVASTGIIVSGQLLIRSSSVFQFDGNEHAVAALTTLESGSLATHTGPVESSTVSAVFRTGVFDLQAGATVSVSGKGLRGGLAVAPGLGSGGGGAGSGGSGGGGAGHASVGGRGGIILNGGAVYGDARDAFDLGSGGGGYLAPCFGGAGGGRFRLIADSATINGRIEANGADGGGGCAFGGGAGSGGTIRVQTADLFGTGVLAVDGGTGGTSGVGGGGGSGGRLSIVSTGTLSLGVAVSSAAGLGGIGGPSGDIGGPGSTFISPKYFTGGGLSFCTDAGNWWGNLLPQDGEFVVFDSTGANKDCTWAFGTVKVGSMTLRSGYLANFSWSSFSSEITGSLSVEGGTFTMNNVGLKIGGDFTQTGGVFNLTQGTVTFAGASSQTVRMTPAASFNRIVTNAGRTFLLASSMDLNGHWRAIGPSTVTLTGGTSVFLSGDLDFDSTVAVLESSTHAFVLDGSSSQLLRIPRMGQLRVRPGSSGRLASGFTLGVSSGVTIDAGGVLFAQSAVLASSGDWINDGTFDGTGGTVAFGAAGSTQTIVRGGAGFHHFRLDEMQAVVRLATDAFVGGDLSVLQGILDLGVSTHRVRGHWIESSSGTVRPGGGVVVFDGSSPQTVFQSTGSAFHTVVSSNASGVTFATHTVLTGAFSMESGVAAFPGISLRIGGDFFRRGGVHPSVAGSTVTLDGIGIQRVDLSTGTIALDSLVIANSSGGVSLDNSLFLDRDLTISTGAVLFGSSGTLTLRGASARLNAFGAVYRSTGPVGHRLRLQAPPGREIIVAADSTIGASMEIIGKATLAGDLVLDGTGEFLTVGPGAELDARSSTITLRGTTDLRLSTGSLYRRDADSWLVFAGSGSNRGLTLSTGPFGNLRVAPEWPQASFRFADLTLDGSFVYENGSVRNSTGAVLTVKGDLRIEGSSFDFASFGSSTVRFAGTSVQTASVPASARFHDFEVASSSPVVFSTGSAVSIFHDLLLTGGSLRGSDAAVSLWGNWTGTGGAFIGETSTISLVNPATTQTFVDSLVQNFHGLTVSSGTRVFKRGFGANAFTALTPATTIQFGSGETFTILGLTVNGNSLTSPVVLTSTATGLSARFVVTQSTVTAARVQDIDASGGAVINVNDGRSVSGGNTPGWNFISDLMLLAPGESFVQATGKVGAPTPQVAGTTFTVTVLAVSDRFVSVSASSITVSLATSDPFDVEPSSRALLAGTTTFPVVLRTAEPSPLNSVLTPTSPSAIGQTGSTVPVNPSSFDRLQMVFRGQSVLPGSPLGMIGTPEIELIDRPFSLTIRGTDAYWNLISTTGAGVALATSTAAGAVFPAPLQLVGGTTVFSGVVIGSTGVFTITSSHTVDSSILPVIGSTFSVFSISNSSPSITFDLPNNAVVGTLSGSLTGRANDSVAVAVVRVAVQDKTEGKYYDWNAGTFTAPAADFRQADVEPFRGRDVIWKVALSDEKLVEGRRYFMVARSTNPTELEGQVESTFTFRFSDLLFSPGDGEGTASLTSESLPGCGIAVATVTFTVGPSGIGLGGAVALRIPEGWTKPAGLSPGAAPAVGYAAIVSTSPAWTVPASSPVVFNPVSIGSSTLGDNWIVVSVATNAANGFAPGEQIAFTYAGIAAAGAGGTGPQFFDLRTRKSAAGDLIGISTTPVLTLSTGPPAALAFSDVRELSLGPLQQAPTAQIYLTDACGNRTPAAAPLNVFLSAEASSGAARSTDFQAEFIKSGGFSSSFVTIGTGQSGSESFFFRTSTTGVQVEILRASATLSGSAAYAERVARLSTSTLAFTGVSIDTGTLSLGSTSVVLTPGSHERAVVRFTLPAAMDWSVSVGTSSAMDSTLLRSGGVSEEGETRVVPFDPIRCGAGVCRFLDAGRYGVRVQAAAGVLEDRTLELRILETPSLSGTLGTAGAGALVRADGPGVGAGHFDRATSTGYFRIRGLRPGASYSVTATTLSVVDGAAVTLSTVVGGVIASSTDTSLGILGFDSLGTFRISVGIPVPAPTELFGGVTLESADASRRAFGTLHYPKGAARSDDGGQILGRNASTWTVLAIAPGVYTATVELASLGISSTIPSITVSSGITHYPVTLTPRANLYGRVILPSTQTYGTFVAVQAIAAGKTVPSVFGGGFISPADSGVVPTSTTYSLFGLAAGSWTIRAESRGFKSTSSALFVSGSGEIGDSITGAGGLDLSLELGAVLVGSVTVLGDTRRLDGSGETDIPGLNLKAGPGRFFVFVDAYDPASFARGGTVVELSTAASQSVATFTITGLDPGEHWVDARLPGFRKDPARAARVAVSSAAPSRADIVFRANEARIRLVVEISTPASPCSCAADFARVGASFTRPDGSVRVVSNLTSLDGVDGASFTYYQSSFSFLSPPLEGGFHRILLRDGISGGFDERTVPAALGSTATATAALNRATYTISGAVSFSGGALFLKDGFSISVSSVPGLLSQSATGAFCLLGSTAPVSLPALRVELLPIERTAPGEPGSLFVSTSSNCADFSLPASSASAVAGLSAYAAAVKADGSFSIPGIPEGVYRLRIPGDLNATAADGNEMAPFDQELRVASAAALSLRLKAGSRVAGVVRAPDGVAVDRAIRVSLFDSRGRRAATNQLRFNAERSRGFVFDSVADGDYTLAAEDLGARATLAAEPLLVSVAGAEREGLELSLVAGGNIVGRIAVEQRRPDGTRSFTGITPDNLVLLPPGLRVVASANPWRLGGYGAALGEECGEEGCARLRIDANGQFVVPALLPGTYDLEFNIANGSENTLRGSLDLVSAVSGGITVESNRTTDAGIVRLIGAAAVSGSVVDAVSGVPVANLPIRAVPSVRTPGTESRRRAEPETQTDNAGSYLLRGLDPAVRYYDIVAAPRSEDENGSRTRPYATVVQPSVDVVSTTTVDFSLLPSSFSVSGAVAAEDGGTLRSAGERSAEPGALVVLRKDGKVEALDSVEDLRLRTFPDGLFTIPAVATGTYSLRVYADGYGLRKLAVIISTRSVDLGTITLSRGASVAGRIVSADGTAPGEDEISSVFAATPDMSRTLFGSLTRDPNTRTVTGYRVSGLDPGTGYRVLLRSSAEDIISPENARFVVATSSFEARTVDLVYRRPRPAVLVKSRRTGTAFDLAFETNRPLRSRKRSDGDASLIISTVSAQGTLSVLEIAADRRRVRGVYTPGVSESSFTLRFAAYSAIRDPDSADPSDPEYRLVSTFTFYPGLDGYHQAAIPNLTGGKVSLETDPGRVSLPEGAFFVDASSTVRVALERSDELLQDARGLQAAGYTPEGANLKALRHPTGAYPGPLARALAATPPGVTPMSSFYDVLLPAGVPTTLAKPAELTLRYSTGASASSLGVYWYNAAANTYVRQTDAGGVGLRIDGGNRTVTISVDHFSTYVLFDSGVAAISGNQFAGGGIEAFNFPNPFDLSVKTVTPIHGVPARAVRGTLIRFALPPEASGAGSLRIYAVTGRQVRGFDLGTLTGGKYYYQAWDGRNDGGNDAASGVYIGQVKVGEHSAFFKMALIK